MRWLNVPMVIVISAVLACSSGNTGLSRPVEAYLAETGPLLGSTADAFEEWRRLEAERGQAIIEFTDFQNIDLDSDEELDARVFLLRAAIQAEGDALDSLYSLVSESVVTLRQINPPDQCLKAHLLITESQVLMQKALKEFKESFEGSPDPQTLVCGHRLLMQAFTLNEQSDPELAKCIS